MKAQIIGFLVSMTALTVASAHGRDEHPFTPADYQEALGAHMICKSANSALKLDFVPLGPIQPDVDNDGDLNYKSRYRLTVSDAPQGNGMVEGYLFFRTWYEYFTFGVSFGEYFYGLTSEMNIQDFSNVGASAYVVQSGQPPGLPYPVNCHFVR